MRQAERAVRQAKSIVVGTLDDEEQLLDRLEWDVRSRRRRRVARAEDLELLFCQRKWVRQRQLQHAKAKRFTGFAENYERWTGGGLRSTGYYSKLYKSTNASGSTGTSISQSSVLD